MENKILFKNDHIVIEDFGNKVLFYQIIGFVNIDTIQMLDKELKTAITKIRAKKIISDTREMKTMTPEARQYNNDYLIPMFENLGIIYNAGIFPENVFAQLAAKVIVQNIETRSKENQKAFEFKMFKNQKEAIEWITSQP